VRSEPSQNQSRILVHPLAYVRHDRNWSQQDLVDKIARRLNTAARREKAWRWERWGVVPDLATQCALADELGVPRQAVRELGWPHWLPVGQRIDTDTPWTIDGGLTLLRETAGAAVMDRRGFMILGVGAAATLAQQWLTLDPPPLRSALDGGPLDASLVDCFEQRLPALRQIDALLGGGSVRDVVDAELRLVTDLLNNSSYADSIGRRMFAVATELGRIAGWASFDAGHQAAAERYWVAALHTAHLAADRTAGANILKCMSLQRVDSDRADEALALATAAVDGAGDAPARVLAMFATRQARAHAALNDASAAERCLTRAETHMARADDEPSPAWAGYFDQAEYCAQVAACYLMLDRHQNADRWLAQALDLQPTTRSRDRATYLIWRADVTASLGDVEQACAYVHRAAPEVVKTRSLRNHHRLMGIHSRLAKYDTPATRELDERVRTLVA